MRTGSEGRWSEWLTPEAGERALACAKGCYQTAIVLGHEAMSGSTLKGKASRYGARYSRSRSNLVTRIAAAGVRVQERIGEHRRRILVIGP